jgi:hypothetical protein
MRTRSDDDNLNPLGRHKELPLISQSGDCTYLISAQATHGLTVLFSYWSNDSCLSFITVTRKPFLGTA